ncbi:hypothetical protein [Neisseria musculi]|uniref:hypothetical protein n=1 Tax=Neisseria musculi TaxID=1815583 RepID=UPI00164ADA35|nr:hypothetical protein [Neisseria musculi]
MAEAAKPEEILFFPPSSPNNAVTGSAVEVETLLHQDIRFVGACQKKVAQALIKTEIFRPRGRDNLISAIHKFILCEKPKSSDWAEKHKIARLWLNYRQKDSLNLKTTAC